MVKETWIYQSEDIQANLSGRECTSTQMCCTDRNCNILHRHFL